MIGSELSFGEATFVAHGGALDAARRRFPHAPLPWLDLSTGINPVPYPLPALPADVWGRLPEAADVSALEGAAARRYGLPAGRALVAAPGSQALIQHLPAFCEGTDVRLLAPLYSEFEPVFRHAGRTVRAVSALDALRGADVAILVNPNNPDGRTIDPRDLAALASRVDTLVVDEAFMDFAVDGLSLAPTAPDRAVILRSFGKTYGLAGLRLGFALLSEPRAARLRRNLGPWPVSGPALSIGTMALRDDVWLRTARERLVEESRRIDYLLRAVGATRIGETPLFTLVAHPAAARLFTHLAEAGILTRPFAAEPRWLRLGRPADAGEWMRLERALDAFA